MKVCIVRPAVLHKEMAFSHMPGAPLGPAYIAAVLQKAGHDVQAIDAAVEGFYDVEKYKTDRFRFDTYVFGLNIENTVQLIKADTEIICFSLMYTNNWYFDRELVAAARKKFPDAIVIIKSVLATKGLDEKEQLKWLLLLVAAYNGLGEYDKAK